MIHHTNTVPECIIGKKWDIRPTPARASPFLYSSYHAEELRKIVAPVDVPVQASDFTQWVLVMSDIMLIREHYFFCWSQMIPKTQRGDQACQSHTQPRQRCRGKSIRI